MPQGDGTGPLGLGPFTGRKGMKFETTDSQKNLIAVGIGAIIGSIIGLIIGKNI